MVHIWASDSPLADLILTRERDWPSFWLLYFNSSSRVLFLSKILAVSVVLFRLIFVSELLRRIGVFGGKVIVFVKGLLPPSESSMVMVCVSVLSVKFVSSIHSFFESLPVGFGKISVIFSMVCWFMHVHSLAGDS